MQVSPHQDRKWWGWGTESGFAGSSEKTIRSEPDRYVLIPPKLSEIKLREPRVKVHDLPAELRKMATDDTFERLLHSRGRSFEDIYQNLIGKVDNPTDLVFYPKTEADIQQLFEFCSANNIAVIPFGAGSSVCDGVSPPDDHLGYRGCITVDMKQFDRVLEVDIHSMCIRVQAGIYGPALEEALKPYNVSLRYYPQSFEFSTVGGWIATRGGGHYATGLTHIDEMVQSVRVVSPAGVVQTRRLPASGAGPAEHRHYVGSEGIYGIITEAWLRVVVRPTYRASASITFTKHNPLQSFLHAAECMRKISQLGVLPSNLRLIEGPEAYETGAVSDDRSALMLVGFESTSCNLDEPMRAVLDVCKAEGGESDAFNKQSWTRQGGVGERQGSAGSWAMAFKLGGYLRDQLLCMGNLRETFETCVTWDKFVDFHLGVVDAVQGALKQLNVEGRITCRFTHIYPDGPAPYYTVSASIPVPDQLQAWRLIKARVMDAIIRLGGTSTHHHAVGKMHRPAFEEERGALFGATLAAVKSTHDPAWVLNPEVLIKAKPRSRL